MSFGLNGASNLKSHYTREHSSAYINRLDPRVKSVIVRLRLKGGKIHQIARGLQISSRTVWQTIKQNQQFYKETFFNYDCRRLPRQGRNRLIEVKIGKTAAVLSAWLIHYQTYGVFNLDSVLSGDRPP